MDKLEIYRQAIEKVLSDYARYKPSHGEIEMLRICDRESDRYLLMGVGWDNTGRVHDVVLHLRIRGDKIWIEWDGTGEGVTQELLDLGVMQDDIVLGFYRPENRALTGFAIA